MHRFQLLKRLAYKRSVVSRIGKSVSFVIAWPIVLLMGCSPVKISSADHLAIGMSRDSVYRELGHPENVNKQEGGEVLEYTLCVAECWRVPGFRIETEVFVIIKNDKVAYWQKGGKLPVIDKSQNCFDAIPKDPDLSILTGKVALDGQSTFAIYANNNLPTEEEKEAIALWQDKRAKCMKLANEHLDSNAPDEVAIYTREYFAASIMLAVELYASKLTYSEFAKLRDELHQEYRVRMDDLKKSYRIDAARAEDAKRNAQYQKIDALNRAIDAQQQEMKKQEEIQQEHRHQQEMQRDQQQHEIQMQQQEMQRNRTTHTECYTRGENVHCETSER